MKSVGRIRRRAAVRAASRLVRAIPLLAIAGGVLAWTASPAGAVPVFARKYGFKCTMCHAAFPRLNDFGQRYRLNGYRVPGREADERTVLQTAPPFAARTSAGWTTSGPVGSPKDKLLQVEGVDLFSAGLLDMRIGYILAYLPEIGAQEGVAAQTGSTELANFVFSRVALPWAYVRAGRFEPGFIGFSQARRLSVTPYEIYGYDPRRNVSLAQSQTGIELSTFSRFPLRYRTGFTTGPRRRSTEVPVSFYDHLSYVFGPGEGQSAGQRIGVGAEWMLVRTFIRNDRSWAERYGADASLNAFFTNLSLQYVWLRDPRELWFPTASRRVDYQGGFAEMSFFPFTRFVFFGRYDRIKTPTFVDQNVNTWTGGARLYPVENLAFHAEYSQRREHRRPRHDFVTARVDLAF